LLQHTLSQKENKMSVTAHFLASILRRNGMGVFFCKKHTEYERSNKTMSTRTDNSSQSKQSTSIHTQRVIIVTNRGPVEYYLTQDGKLKSRRGSGGVVTALLDTMKQVQATWVSLAMTEGDRQAFKDAPDGVLSSPLDDKKMQLRYVSVPKAAYHKHYDLISNRVLWFLQHYLSDAAHSLSGQRLQNAWDEGYVKVNQTLAEAVCTEIARVENTTTIILHDYHLYLVSRFIREQYPSIVIEQFIHIPWPEIRYWESSLPTQLVKSIFQGLLGNDILGFQTRQDAQNFIDGVRRLFEDASIDSHTGTISYLHHRVSVHDYPISISVTEERKTVQGIAGKRAARKIEPLLQKYTIIRVDRIEPTKNIVRGFEAYQILLEQHPELLEQIVFLAFLIPSRQTLRLYRQYRDEIQKIIDSINQKYARNGWVPIKAFEQNDRVQALAAMRFYDVLLVNSLFDGMNLVAKEGSVVNQKQGVLVLSRTSGAFQQMEHASIPISPNDAQETAEAIYKGLLLPQAERNLLARRAREEVETHTLDHWIADQISDINHVLDRK
jgi:trehalose 6-phosphate synthase